MKQKINILQVDYQVKYSTLAYRKKKKKKYLTVIKFS